MYLLIVYGQDQEDEPEDRLPVRIANVPAWPAGGRLSRSEADQLRVEAKKRYAQSLVKTHGISRFVVAAVAEWLKDAVVGDYLSVPGVSSCVAMTIVLLDSKKPVKKTLVSVEKVPTARLVREDDDEDADEDDEEADPDDNDSLFDDLPEEEDEEPRKKPKKKPR